jgi:hypothetical protein
MSRLETSPLTQRSSQPAATDHRRTSKRPTCREVNFCSERRAAMGLTSPAPPRATGAGQTRSRGRTDLNTRASTIAGLDRRHVTQLRFRQMHVSVHQPYRDIRDIPDGIDPTKPWRSSAGQGNVPPSRPACCNATAPSGSSTSCKVASLAGSERAGQSTSRPRQRQSYKAPSPAGRKPPRAGIGLRRLAI